MATNDIEIRLSVVGGQETTRALEKVEAGAEDLKEGVKGVGEGFKSVGDLVKAQGGLMGDAFGTLGDSVIQVTDSVSMFKDGLNTAGATGAKAWLQLLGPIAAVITAISIAIDAYRQFSGAAREAEEAEENMAAAAGDTASRLEAMVEKGIHLSTDALREFIEVNQKARLAIEQAIKINERRTKTEIELRQAREGLTEAEGAWLFQSARVYLAQLELNDAERDYNKILEEQVKKQKEASDLQTQSFELEQLRGEDIYFFAQALEEQAIALSELNEEYESTASKAKLAEAQANLDTLLEQKQISREIYKIATDELKKNNEAIGEENIAAKSAAKVRIEYLTTIKQSVDAQKSLDKLLKEGTITQKAYDEATKNNKKSLKDLADGLKETAKAKGIDLKLDMERMKLILLGGTGGVLSKYFASGKTAINTAVAEAQASSAFQKRQSLFDREIELMGRQKGEIDMLSDEVSISSQEANVRYVRSAQDWLLSSQRIKDALKGQSTASIQDAKDLAQGLSSVSTTIKQALETNQDSINRALAGEGGGSALVKFTTDLKQGLSDVESQAGTTLQKVLTNITKVELDTINKRKDFQTKNRKALNLTQKQIDEDYLYAVSNLAETSRKSLSDLMKTTATTQLAFEEQRVSQKHSLDKQIQDTSSATSLIIAELNLKNKFISDSQDLSLVLQKTAIEDSKRMAKVSFDTEQQNLENQKDLIQRKLALLKFELEQNAAIRGVESVTLRETYEREKVLAEIQLATIEDNAKKAQDLRRKTENDALVESEKLMQEEILLAKKRSFELSAIFVEEEELRKDILSKRIQEEIQFAQESLKPTIAELDSGIKQISQNINNLKSILDSFDDSMDGASQSEKNRFNQNIELLKQEEELLTTFLKRKENLLLESSQKVASIQDQARKMEAEKAFADMQIIAQELKDMYIGQVQTIASGLATIFYDETRDQKIKELNANRQVAMDQYKNDMKARAEIDKQYIAQKRQIEAEDANMVSNLLKQTLRAVATEALMKSIYHTGLGIGALALGPLAGVSAAGHFKAAAVFAGLAAIAGMSSKAVGSGATAGASTSLSPTGASQTTSSPIRESAKSTEPIVFNINLSGSTIYDTRQAAEQAMADRIVTMANRARRGSPSFSR